ncbi:462_t:CDS:2, partial [Entrophospora sp. SA101]
MLLPPIDQFSSYDELLAHVRAFVLTQGYAVTIMAKQTVSRLLDCPFELHGTRCNGVWFLEVHNSEHNHEASEDMSGHPITHRLNTEQRELVQQMSATGSHPREILSTIHQSDLSSMVISRTIYNNLHSIHEKEADYEWALSYISKIFNGMSHPKVIVTYQELALMNVIGRIFPEEDWTEFIELWKAYLQETWILHKECFISAWVDRYLHLGNKATSQVEGAHATLKKYLQSSRVQHVYRIALFEPLLCCVSVFALKKICDEWIKASNATLDSPLNPCSGILSSTMGLPCSHLISERIANGQTLQQTDIHEHWWIKGCHFEFLGDLTCPVNGDHTNLQLLLQSFAQQYQFWPPHQQAAAHTQLEELTSAPPDVLGNPEVSRPQGRPVGARNQREGSMQRDPSAFELVERRPRKCGICCQTGHNSEHVLP